MVDKDLIQRLHDEHIIDKRYVLWWQLGFEGREILTEDELNAGLQTAKWIVKVDITGEPIEPREEEFRFWNRDEVPILIRTINLGGIEIPSFVSVKPQTHRPSGGVEHLKQLEIFPLPVYEQPHVRGVVIERKDKFLFWYPFTWGIGPSHNLYFTREIFLEEEKMHCLIYPVHPTKFYRNIVENSWSKGKRTQKKAKEFEYQNEGYELVPYFEFDTTKKQVMVYPVPLFERRLDVPVFIKTTPRYTGVDVIGAGYTVFSGEIGGICYWELQNDQKRLVRRTLEKTLS